MTSRKQGLPKVLVCQNTTCKQQGAQKVLAAFERCVPEEVMVEASGCMGQCGNGPMVIVLTENADGESVTGEKVGETLKPSSKPQKTWYSTVKPADAFAIASQHFKKAPSPVRKQSVQMQTKQNFFWIWLVGLILFFAMCGLFALVLGGPSHYG